MNKTKPVSDVRVQAAVILAAVVEGQSLSPLLDKYKSHFSPKDAGLLQELCFGCCRHFYALDHQIKSLMQKNFKKKDTDLHCLLLVGAYQLQYTRIPDHAAISSCVEASRGLNKQWATKLLNGVLRNLQRQLPDKSKTSVSLEARYSHPAWMIEKLQSDWPDHWQEVLQQNNLKPPLTLRVNEQKTTVDAFVASVSPVSYTACKYSKTALSIDSDTNITELPGFTEGNFSVQDEAAQLAAMLMDLGENQRVLDACCAPGGKCCHMAELSPTSQVVAVDIDASRNQRVQNNIERLRLNNVEVLTADVGDGESWWDGQLFDRILLDAPCSASGVIRRHPDIKLLRQPGDIAKLATLQFNLLNKMWALLKPGGRLVYATCSIFKQENEELVERFLGHTPNANALELDVPWGHARPVGRQLFAQEAGHDGFYYAVLTKAHVTAT